MSSATTRMVYGMFWQPTYYGTAPLKDGSHTDGGAYATGVSVLGSAGARSCLNLVGGSSFYKDPATSAFSLAMWISRFSSQASRITPELMNTWIDTGAVLSLHMLDDLKPGSPVFPGGVPNGANLDEMAKRVKSVFTRLPCSVRADNVYLASIAPGPGSKYTWLDFGWAQWIWTQGAPLAYFQNNINAGLQCGLGTMLGWNLLDGGQGNDPAWQFRPGNSLKFGMNPTEIRAVADAASQVTMHLGAIGWQYLNSTDGTPSYYNKPEIYSAHEYLASKLIGRVASPVSTRGLSTGSAAVVVGSWGLVGSVTENRTGDPTFMNVTYPSGLSAGNLICCIVYSRDGSAKSSLQPSGWSTAKAISGTSKQGGQLVMYYKFATGLETGSQRFDFSGTGGGGMAMMAEMFGVSGNTDSSLSFVLAGTGSARSWVGSSNMGPVPGMTSTNSDPLILVVAAKTNDFNSGDPPAKTVMSATTGDDESWTRLLLVTHSSGDDAGLLCDYMFTLGLASVETKQWSQVSNAGSNTSGPGCGFMVAFAPYRVFTGAPPSIVDLTDTGVVLNSLFSMTLVSGGSTPITWSVTTGPSNVTLGLSTGLVNWTPLSAGTFQLGFKAVNSWGSDTAGLFVTVANPSSVTTVSGSTVTISPAPVIDYPGDRTVRAHDLVSFIATATDADSEVLTFGLDPSSPSGTFIDQQSGQFLWMPSEEQAPGVYPIILTASDGVNQSRSTFTVTVQDVPWTREHGFTNRFRRFT